MSQPIFVSYRRSDSADVCGRICDHLGAEFGRDAVFEDVRTIPLGTDFGQFIGQKLETCRIVLALIGPSWVDVQDRQGKRRIDNPDDWVRREIELALSNRHVVVAPVLIGSASMPDPNALPDSLRKLTRLNSARVRPDPDFDADIAALLKSVRVIAFGGGGLSAAALPQGGSTVISAAIQGNNNIAVGSTGGSVSIAVGEKPPR